MPMIPTSKASRCVAVLRDGPATTSEIAAEVGMDVHLTCAHLGNLFHAGKLDRREFRAAGKRRCWLWSLADRTGGAP